MLTPRSLLERLRSQPDEVSWERLVELYGPWMERILQQARVAPADRDDLRQEVFSTVIRELPQFEHNGRTGAFRRWLRTIVFHRLQAYWRSQRAAEQRIDGRSEVDDLAAPLSDLESFWDQEHDRYVAGQLLKLVERSFTQSVWQAFRRQVLDGCQAADVARELGLSVNAVLLSKSRVLQRLRLEADGLIEHI